MTLAAHLFGMLFLVPFALGAPPGFPSTGNGLWYTASGNYWARDWLPVGNGYLSAMLQGGVTSEVTQLNIESLWTGGPFSNSSYNGANRQPSEQTSLATAMKAFRAAIFASSSGVADNSAYDAFGTDAGSAYGSFSGAGYLISNINSTGTVSNYARWLDLDQAIARTTWTQSGTTYLRSTFCSNPTKTCVQHIAPSGSSGSLPAISFAFSSALVNAMPAPNVTCAGNDTLRIRGLNESPQGMLFETLVRVRSTPSGSSSQSQCIAISGSRPNATLHVPAGSAKEVWISWFGDTEWSQDAGTPAANFSYKGPDPHDLVLATISSSTAGSITYDRLLSQHVADHKTAMNPNFALTIGQTPNLNKPTNELRDAYKADVGDKYIEWLLFNYARYMLVASSRGKLPANLQGKWAQKHTNPWGSDYHADINLQMNYWAAETTNLNVNSPLWTYMQKNWIPRGQITAKTLYNITRGWVVHTEMNIFGFSGMKLSHPKWSDFPESNAWMMMHVWDHFDFTNDVQWWKSQGWPLLKGAAQFQIDKLIPDQHYNDSTLVVVPCNSPEQDGTTFGCAQAQQTIWQLFNSVEKGFAASGDTDQAFLNEVKSKRSQMDKGIRVGSWGQLQEWKVDRDSRTNLHRHLSHLVGLYPGYAISGYDSAVQPVPGKTYTRQQIIDAAKTSLVARGEGTADANAGWEKMWRAATWAQLGNSTQFFREISLAIQVNIGSNLFSLYDPNEVEGTFQIDANLAYPAAVMNALIQAPDTASYSTPIIVTLLPALPAQWSSGSIKSARIRGGMTVDIQWSSSKPTRASFKVDSTIVSRPVQVVYGGKTVASFTTSPNLTKTLTNF